MMIKKTFRIKNYFGLKCFYSSALSILLLVSCNPLKILGGLGSSEQYSLIPIDGLSTTHIPNDKFFYVNLSASYYVGEGFDPLDAVIYAMDEGPGTDCKIASSEDSTEDLYCVLEVMEGDLWFHNIVLEYNVPAEICDYLTFDVPWHLNQKTGRGPRTVHECSDFVISLGDAEDVEIPSTNNGGSSTTTKQHTNPEIETRYCLDGCVYGTLTAQGNPTRTSRCTKGAPRESAEEFCGTLNLSEQDMSNCCFGEYNLINQGSTGGTSRSETPSQWGGSFRECIGGPARFSWDTFNKAGVPITLVRNALKSGLRDEYELEALVDVYDGFTCNQNANAGDDCANREKRPTFITANYWDDMEEKDFTTNKPKFYTPATGSQLPGGSTGNFQPDNREGYPYFTWSCMDKAQEIKHRIHLAIREWNTQEEFNKFKESLGSNGDSNVVGQEGSICEYYESDEPSILKDTDCNDAQDIDNWENLNHGTGDNYNPYPHVIYKGGSGG